MFDFIRKKLVIVNYTAKAENTNIFWIFFRKLMVYVWRNLVINTDLLITLLFFPLCLIYTYLRRMGSSLDKKKIFFFGLEHVIDKSARRGKMFEERGFDVTFFAFDWYGKKASPIYNPKVITFYPFIFMDVIRFCWMINKQRPVYIEFYAEGSGPRQVFALIFAKIMGVLTLYIERAIYYEGTVYESWSFTYLQSLKFIMKQVNHIFYRDPDMGNLLKRFGVDLAKSRLDSNKVFIKTPAPDFEKKADVYNVIYLNGFTMERKVEVLVKAIPLVKKHIPNVNFLIVGARNNTERMRVITTAKEIGLEGGFELHEWTENPKEWFDQAHVFVMPSTFVFCNFALIEAMERGLPAVVSDVKYADLLVNHGYNGFVSKLTPEDFANHIVEILKDDAKRIQMGKNARQKMMDEYDDAKRLDPILEFISKVPNAK